MGCHAAVRDTFRQAISWSAFFALLQRQIAGERDDAAQFWIELL